MSIDVRFHGSLPPPPSVSVIFDTTSCEKKLQRPHVIVLCRVQVIAGASYWPTAEERPQGARLYSAMRSSFIVPLQSSHSLIQYSESVLTERALIASHDRSSDPL